jgi:hypothetical protein
LLFALAVVNMLGIDARNACRQYNRRTTLPHAQALHAHARSAGHLRVSLGVDDVEAPYQCVHGSLARRPDSLDVNAPVTSIDQLYAQVPLLPVLRPYCMHQHPCKSAQRILT